MFREVDGMLPQAVPRGAQMYQIAALSERSHQIHAVSIDLEHVSVGLKRENFQRFVNE
jgi:hypothetical protein